MWRCVFQRVVQDVSARSVLRPVPVLQTSSVTDILGTVCVRVVIMTVHKVFNHEHKGLTRSPPLREPIFDHFPLCLLTQTPPSSRGALWFLFLLGKRNPGEPSGASWCSSSWWFCCWLCCCSTAAGRRTSRTTRRASPSPPAAPSTLNTLFQVQ